MPHFQNTCHIATLTYIKTNLNLRKGMQFVNVHKLSDGLLITVIELRNLPVSCVFLLTLWFSGTLERKFIKKRRVTFLSKVLHIELAVGYTNAEN